MFETFLVERNFSPLRWSLWFHFVDILKQPGGRQLTKSN